MQCLKAGWAWAWASAGSFQYANYASRRENPTGVWSQTQWAEVVLQRDFSPIPSLGLSALICLSALSALSPYLQDRDSKPYFPGLFHSR